MRLFIAVLLSDELKAYLRLLQEPLLKLNAKLTLVKDFHLTLKFLGEVPGSMLPAIEESLARVRFAPFTFALTDIGFFPDVGRPRVIWIGAEPGETIHALQTQVDRALLQQGFPKDTRFHPHLTLARVKFIKDTVARTTQKHSQPVDSFELIESTLTPQGPVYRTIKTFKSNT